MQAVIGLVLVTLSSILAQTDIGGPCGDNIGEINFIDNCTTAILVPNISKRNDHWCSNSNIICCIKSSNLTQNKRFLRKSEKACEKFGPGIQRKVSSANYVQPGDYQHDLALGYLDARDNTTRWGFCGGILISEYFVVTTADCILVLIGRPAKIRAGTIDLLGEEDRVEPQDINVVKTIVHPDYDTYPKSNNIGLMRLAKAVVFTSYVQPACLYTKSDVPDEMIVTGWGRILKTDSAYNDLLLKSTVVTMDNRNCDDIYSKRGRSLSNFEFCGVIGTNICFATQGSAAFKTKGDDSRAIIFGLTSDGGPECGSETPIIFTKISSYLNWIENIVWPGM